MVGLGVSELIVILMIALMGGVLWIVPFWLICKKAGYSPGLAFFALIPMGSIGLLFFLAFAEWPAGKVQNEARRL